MRIKSAFTLIEMLVVIAIISILASMLAPSLQGAIAQARNMTCVNNNKQLYQIFAIWSDDNNGWVVPITWQCRLNDYGIKWDSVNGPELGGLLNCPNDESSFWSAPTNNIVVYTGYAVNFALAWPYISPGGSGDGVSPWGTNGVYYATHGNCKLTGVKTPSKFIYSMDGISYIAANPGNGIFLDNFRHTDGSTVNCAWMDGHVSSAEMDVSVSKNTGAPSWHTYYPAFYP